MAHKATESISLEEAADRLAESEAWVRKVMRRLEPRLPERRPLRVLDLGAAQGRILIALQRLGCDAHGVEPWARAREVATQLAAREGMDVSIRRGSAEKIPFGDGTFDAVLAFSVMEHVSDLERSLREIHRVLVPGGVFWFYSASAVCPRQAEIRAFPLFGWYPDPIKRRIMLWARDHRPALIGDTEAPALHWWTPRKAGRQLREAGFDEIWDRWELLDPSELTGPKGALAQLARRYRVARLLADIVEEGCAYAAKRES